MQKEEDRLLVPLSFPPAKLRLKRVSGNIHVWCFIRRKFLRLTPEEWVRQHLVHFLVFELGYPAGLISLEKGTSYQTMSKRTDALVFNSKGQALMLIECKASSVPLTDEVLHQVAQYNHSIGAHYVMISNGILFKLIYISPVTSEMTELDHIPDWNAILNC